MTAPTLGPDATRCPDCRGPLTGPGSCPSCGLPLTGPAATRLWEVEHDLLRLEHAHARLLDERRELLATLRAGVGAVPAQGGPPQPEREWTAERVQNLLLLLGGLLLAGAALVFTAVTYERLGATGRAVVLALLTLAAGAASPRLRARGLRATAETLAAVTLALAALDAYGLRTLGLAADAAPLTYAAGSAAALAVCGAAYARLVPLHVTRIAPVVLAQLPVPLLLLSFELSPAGAGAALAALTAADVGILAGASRRLADDVRSTLLACAIPVGTLALLVSSLAAVDADPRPGAAALLACAVVLAGASLPASGAAGPLLAGSSVVVLGAAAGALVLDRPAVAPLVLSAVGLAAALVAARLPRGRRTGPAGGALVVTAGAVLAGAEHVDGMLLPLTWVSEPWTLAAGRSARAALPVGLAWTGSAAVPALLLVAAAAVALAARSVGLARLGAGLGGLLATAALALLPLGLDLPYPAALVVLLLAGAALAAGSLAVRDRSADAAGALAAAAAALGLLAVGWSLAEQTATLVALPAAALVAAGLATTSLPWRAVAVAGAGLLTAAELAAAGAAAGLARDQVGALLVLAVTALVGLAALLDRDRRAGADAAAAVAGAAALLLTADTVGWLSWTLLGLGLLALASALRPDRRRVAILGGLLLTASSWVRLDDAGISAPEPYVLPAALVAVTLGHLRRRSEPGTPSWSAYGPGLSLALVPSLVTSLDDESLLRPLLLGLAALAVLLAGAASRLQAPLVLGGAVLAVDALDLLGPYAAALPRWVSLGLAGALLVVVGATYEQRRRDVGRLRQRYDALA